MKNSVSKTFSLKNIGVVVCILPYHHLYFVKTWTKCKKVPTNVHHQQFLQIYCYLTRLLFYFMVKSVNFKIKEKVFCV